MKKVNVDNKVLDSIVNSLKITESEKIVYLRYVSYLTQTEQKELVELL